MSQNVSLICDILKFGEFISLIHFMTEVPVM